MTNYELVRNKVIEAVPEIQGRNTSMILTGVFTGMINHKDENIYLDDLLLCIKNRYMKGTLQKEGEFKNITEWLGEISWQWDFSQRTLDGQCQDFIDFLAEILK